jgi:hypothetical protein
VSKKIYTVNVGNVGNMEYKSKKLALNCFKTYVTHSKNHETRASGESVQMFMNDDLLQEYIGDLDRIPEDNKLTEILDFFKCLDLIKEAENKKETCVILCPNYSINISMQYEDGEQLQQDLDELSDYLGHFVSVSDYDDLIIDLSENED